MCSGNLHCECEEVDSTILVTSNKVSLSNLWKCGIAGPALLGESSEELNTAKLLADIIILHMIKAFGQHSFLTVCQRLGCLFLEGAYSHNFDVKVGHK